MKSLSKILLLFATIFAFAPQSDAGLTGFDPTGSMTQARGSHTATLLPNGKVLVVSGSTAELYDPATRTWTLTGSPNTPRSAHTATLLANGKVLVAAGRDGSGFFQTQSAELYDPATGTWTPTGSLMGACYSHTATLLPDGRVLIAGGFFCNRSFGTSANPQCAIVRSCHWNVVQHGQPRYPSRLSHRDVAAERQGACCRWT